MNTTNPELRELLKRAFLHIDNFEVPVGTAEIFLALLDDDQSAVVTMLRDFGIDLYALGEELKRRIKLLSEDRQLREDYFGDLHFTHVAMLSTRVAMDLNGWQLHLKLIECFIRFKESVAGRVLKNLGIDIRRIKEYQAEALRLVI